MGESSEVMSKYTEEQFLESVENHTLEVISDNAVYRHLVFSDNGSCHFKFSLITWPDHLCVSGDCGTYVFCRSHDMFRFFRKSSDNKENGLDINPGYWGEKLVSICKYYGYKEFSQEAFEQCVKEHFDGFSFRNDEDKEKTWEAIESDVLRHSDSEHKAYEAANDFYHKKHRLDDFDYDAAQVYTFHYLWNVYAIAWGVEQYDKHILKLTKGDAA